MEWIIIISFSNALKAAQSFGDIKMLSYCQFDKYYVFNPAKPNTPLYGGLFVIVDRQTGIAKYIGASSLISYDLGWLPIEK
ncbi:hypothetical protein [uncultured Acidaminococcus sp.]|uniref:hypothetical protein n=1 Tax=uncultured Acidaminococcus sp. TaxID=352152 RepID=UPI0029439965|nr:hypothetical protein [uncultured Acidaminococcus sp.]